MVNPDNSSKGRSPALQRAYFGKYPYNLVYSGNLHKYCQLLCNFDFLLGKIQHPEFGVQALIEDYNLLDNVEAQKHPDYNPEAVKALRLIQGALRLSAHVLVEELSQLASQLWGRLQNFEMPEIQSLLQQAKQNQIVWLCPLNSSLILPTSRLLRTLTGHSCSINVVAITPNNQQIVAASKDGTIKIWDLATGQELFPITSSNNKYNCYPINAIIVSPDSRQVVSAAEDGTIKICDLLKGQKPLTLAEGKSLGKFSVKALAITSDGKQLISVGPYGVKRWNLETRECEIIVSLQDTDLMKTYNFILSKRDASVTSTTLSSDGTRAIFCVRVSEHSRGAGGRVHLLDRNIIRIKNLETSKEYDIVRPSDHNHITATAISSDGKQAICGWQDGHIEFWDLEIKKQVFALKGHCDEIVAVAIASNGKLAVSSSKDRTLKIWDLKVGKEISTLTDFNDLVYAIVITPDCQQVISGSGDALLKIWNIRNPHDLRDSHGFNIVKPAKETLVNINSSRTFLLILTALINCILLYPLLFYLNIPIFLIVAISLFADLNTNRLRNYLRLFSFLWLIPTTLIFKIVKINKVITNENYTRNIYLNNLQQFAGKNNYYSEETSVLRQLQDKNYLGKLINFKSHTDMITSLSATIDSKWIISGSHDKTIKGWDLVTGKHFFTLVGHQDGISSVATSLNNKYLISASFGKTIKVWNLRNFNKVYYLKSWTGIFYDTLLISICIILTALEIFIIINFNFFGPSLLSLWLLLLLSYPYNLVIDLVNKADFDWGSKIVVTPDSKKIISGSRDQTIKGWDIETRRQLFTLKGHTDWITSVAVTSDSRYLVSGSKDKTLKVWNLKTGKERFTFTDHSSKINAVAVIPNSSKVISGSSDGQIKIWELKTGEETVPINGHRQAVQALALTADGRHFVSAASDCMLKVWDLTTGREVTSFTADNPLTSCVAASDGRIIAGDQAGQLHFFRLENMGL